MIMHQNVCDFCGDVEQITEETPQMGLVFAVVTCETFIKTGKPFGSDYNKNTFCSKNCMIDYLRDHISDTGEIINAEKL